jgi:hypothetical protein
MSAGSIIGNVAAGAVVATGFALPLMGVGALMRERDPAKAASNSEILKVSVPLTIGGLGMAVAFANMTRLGSAGTGLFALSGLIGGASAIVTGAALGQLLLD